MTTRFTIHAGYVNSNETNAIIYNTFTEVQAYCQAVCDLTTGATVKIIDREKKAAVWDGPMDHKVLSDLKSNYEKGE